jgi:hypothetical protein
MTLLLSLALPPLAVALVLDWLRGVRRKAAVGARRMS